MVQDAGKRPGEATPPAPEKPVRPGGEATPLAPEKPVRTIAWRDVDLPPASEDPDAPLLLVHAHSLDRLIDDLKVFLKEVGLSEQVDRFLDVLATNGGNSGLGGIDAKAPLGAYIRFLPGASQPEAVFLIPVKDKDEFLRLLASMNIPADQEGRDLYIIRFPQPRRPMRFRFADGHAYGTFGDATALDDGARIAPGRLFAQKSDCDMVVTARFDRLPAPMREAIRRQSQGLIAQLLAQMGGTSGEKQAQAGKLVESAATMMRNLVDGKAELTLRMGVDPAAREFVADLHFRAAPGSILALYLSTLTPGPSRFGGMIAGDPAMALLLHFQFPEDARRQLAAAAREAGTSAARDADPEFGKVLVRLAKILEKASELGEVDVAVAARSQGAGRMGVLWGLKVPDAEALDGLMPALVAKVEPPEYRALFKLNADDFPDVKIHRFETAVLAAEGSLVGSFLSVAPVLMGFSKDAAWLTAGANGRDAIRAAVDAEPRPAPIFHFELNVKAMAEALSVSSPSLVRIDDVRAVLTDEHPGRVRLTLEGGARLRLRFSLDLPLLGLAARFVNLQAQLEARPASP